MTMHIYCDDGQYTSGQGQHVYNCKQVKFYCYSSDCATQSIMMHVFTSAVLIMDTWYIPLKVRVTRVK